MISGKAILQIKLCSLLAASFWLIAATTDVDARGRGAGARPTARASAHANINHPSASTGRAAASRGGSRNSNSGNRVQGGSRDRVGNTNHSGNGNFSGNHSNNNVNIDRGDINVNVNGNHGGGHGGHHDHWNDWDDHPFVAGAALATGVAITSAVIGSIVYSVPSTCVVSMVGNVTYQQCGSTWYQPQYSGTSVQYVVVSAPR